jgi:hypothetical protein
MPQQPLTFGDGIQKIVGILAQMELDPAADDSLIAALRQPILDLARSAGQGQQASPDMGPAAVPGTPDFGGMPMPMPVEEAGLSRGPTPNPDMGGAVEELSRIMAGS